MAFIIEEKFLEGKTNDLFKCEDAVVISEHHAAVIDGATSFNQTKYNGMTTGKYASVVLADEISRLPKDSNLDDILTLLSSSINRTYEELGIGELTKNDTCQRFCASTAIYSNHHNMVWLIGDCQALIDGVHYNNEKSVDTYIYGMRSLYLQSLLAKDLISKEQIQIEDPSWKSVIEPFVMKQYAFQNPQHQSKWAYEVFDGAKVYRPTIKAISTQGKKEIVLATDGYPVLQDGAITLTRTRIESDKRLFEVNVRDPLCIYENFQAKCNQHGTNSFDDRAYIKILA